MVEDLRKESSEKNDECEFVVSGMSGRLPECDNVEEFRDKLLSGADMVTDDGRRWTPGIFDLPKRSGKLKQLDKFDAQFFSVHPKQADHMDPQLRMLLEVTYEAIIDAGVNPAEIRGSRTGVFVGSSGSECEKRWVKDKTSSHGYTLTGTTRGMFSNRVSFTFDFHGPSLTVDTACSSSFIALDQAMKSLRSGACDAAIVAGTHICLSPNMCQQFQRMNMLAADGKCRSFDAAGLGYVRSEAIVAIFIQKKQISRRNYATILQVATNTDGFKEAGVTFPSGQRQLELLQETYAAAGVNPNDVVYVEAHGTGTPAGDPQEVNAIAGALCENNEYRRHQPLLIGSVKSNMGHAEPASGLCGMVKVLLAMQNGVIPKNLHFNTPNPNIPALVEGKMKVVTENTPWEGGIVGINSFGFGGANVHVILKSNSTQKWMQASNLEHPPKEFDDLPILIPFSGRTKEAVEMALCKISEEKTNFEQVHLLHQIARRNIAGHNFRGYSMLSQNSAILSTEIEGLDNSRSSNQPPVWFIFNGMGSQCKVPELLKFRACRESIERSAAILKLVNFDLMDILLNGDEQTFENVLNSFVCITSIQIALVDLLRSLNIQPQGIVGHSVGELGAAYADECLTAEQALKCSFARGQAILEMAENRTESFSMAAVGLSWKEAIEKCPPTIYPACHNSKDSVTLSGPAKDISSFVEELQDEGIFAKVVNSSGHAFHSKYIEPAREKFQESLNKIIPEPKIRSSRWISSSVAESEWSSELGKFSSVDYHVNNLISPVLFQEAIEKTPESSVVIEIGPHCLLSAILKRSLPTCKNIGLLHRNRGDQTSVLCGAIGKIFNCGLNPAINELYPRFEFPVSISTPSLSPLVKFDHSLSWNVPDFSPDRKKSKTAKTSGTEIEICIGKEADSFYAGHKIDGRILFPATGYFLLIWRAFASLQGKQFYEVPIVLEKLKIVRATVFPANFRDNPTPVKFSIRIFEATGQFQIVESGVLVGSGIVREHRKKESEFISFDPIETSEVTSKRIPLSSTDVYKELRLRGYDYSGDFRAIERADPEGGWTEVKWRGNWVTFLDNILQTTLLNDAHRALFLPSIIDKIVFSPQQFLRSICNKSFDENCEDRNSTISNLVRIFHYHNLNVVACEGIQLQGWKNELAPRKNMAATSSNLLKLEKFRFTPYFDENQNLPEKSKLYSKKEVLGVCVDIVLENIGDNKLMMLEILDDVQKSLSPEIQSCCFDHPTKSSNGNVLFMSEEPDELEIEKIKVLEKSGIPVKLTSKTFSNLDTDRLKVDMLIIGEMDLLNNGDILCKILKSDGFVLFHQNPESFDNTKSPVIHFEQSLGLISVSQKISTEGNHFYLFRKPFRPTSLNVSVIEIDKPLFIESNNNEGEVVKYDRNYSWVEELKIAMKNNVEFQNNSKEPQESKEGRIFVVARECSNNTTGILGLVNCLRKEPGGDKIRCFFIRSSNPNPSNLNGLNFSTPNKFLDKILQCNLVMNVFVSNVWGSCRFFPIAQNESSLLKNVDHGFVNIETRGDLSSLRWFESPLKLHQNQSELCRVHFAALNFRDIMIATGKLNLDALPNDQGFKECALGLEFSGRRNDATGQKIMGFVNARALATFVLPEAGATWNVPKGWTMAEAATVPVAYSTAFYALLVRGQLKSGESVLIHSGSGGIGQAAIRIALSMNCKVFITVGSPEKRKFLQQTFSQLDENSFANSRDSSFLQHIMTQTKGRGVDLVLNSLAEEKLQASVKCLAKNGRFLEIGKVDLFNNSSLGMSILLKNVAVHGILLDSILPGDPEQAMIWQLVDQGLTSGVVRPLTFTTFEDTPEQIESAFRFMASGKHVGKVLIQIRKESEPVQQKTVGALPRTYFDSELSYILIGGLGGFGLEMADWMIQRGATKLVLVSRFGVKNGYQDLRVRKWRQKGVNVLISKSQITTPDGASLLLKEAISYFDGTPIGGIFNLSLVLADGLIENQTVEKFQIVCRPKVDATLALDTASRILAPSLQYFVCFSSLSSGRGAPGLSNYSYANSAMERICENRQLEGLPGLAIQWGAVGDVGVLVEDKNLGNESVIGGTVPQRIASCLNTLDILLHESKSGPSPVISSHVLANRNGGEDGSRSGNSGDSTGNDPANSYSISERVAHILGLKSLINVNKQTFLYEMGMDSLMSVEIKQLIQLHTGITLNTADIMELNFAKIEDFEKMSSSHPLPSAIETDHLDTDNSSQTTLALDSQSDDESDIAPSTPKFESDSPEISLPISTVDPTQFDFQLVNETQPPILKVFPTPIQVLGKSRENPPPYINPAKNTQRSSYDFKDDLKFVPPASSSFSLKLRRQISTALAFTFSLAFWLSMNLLLWISLFLKIFVRLHLKIFRSRDEIRIMDRRIDQTCAINPRLSNVIFTVKLGGIPNKAKITRVIEDRVVYWKTNIRLDNESSKKSGENPEEFYQPYEILRWRIRRGCLFTYWEKDPDFRVANQILMQNVSVNLGSESQDLDREALKLVEFYHNYKWPESRTNPPWEMTILVPKYGLNYPAEKKEFLIVFSIHHAYGDGNSILEMLQWAVCDHGQTGTGGTTILPPLQNQQFNKIQQFVKQGEITKGTEKLPEVPRPKMSGTNRGSWKILESLKRTYRFLMIMARHYQNMNYNYRLKCKTPDSPRHCGLAKINLTQVKAIRDQHGNLVPTNSVVLACTSRAYEKIFGERRREIPSSFAAGMPFVVHPNQRLGLVNSVGGNVCEIPLNIPDSLEKLEVIARRMDECCQREQLEIIWDWAHQLTSIINPIQSLLFRVFPSPNLIYTNVPASLPRNKTFFGGYQLKDFAGFPALFSRSHAALASSVDSFNDQMALALVVDQSPLDISPEFVQQFFKYFQEELDHLTSLSCSFSGKLTTFENQNTYEENLKFL